MYTKTTQVIAFQINLIQDGEIPPGNVRSILKCKYPSHSVTLWLLRCSEFLTATFWFQSRSSSLTLRYGTLTRRCCYVRTTLSPRCSLALTLLTGAIRDQSRRLLRSRYVIPRCASLQLRLSLATVSLFLVVVTLVIRFDSFCLVCVLVLRYALQCQVTTMFLFQIKVHKCNKVPFLY